MTAQEYKDINDLADIAKTNGQVGDGMDAELVKHIQDAQKIIMLRVGSRSWFARKQNDV